MKQDLSHLLHEWPYDPEHTMRIITADDGRSVLQVRLPLGIEQYELEGRPDGAQLEGFPTYVNKIEERLRSYIVDNGSDLGFQITKHDAGELQREGALFYYRYLLLFQLNHHLRVIRDTEHNLHLCDLLERYCEDEEGRNAVLQFRPYILRMNAAARALAARAGEIDGDPARIIDETLDIIHDLDEIDTPAFQFERVRSTNYLRVLKRKLTRGSASGDVAQTDPSDDAQTESHSNETEAEPRGTGRTLALLRQELSNAIDDEEYERAAEIRDRIRRLQDADRNP
jgi:hypothetical protein